MHLELLILSPILQQSCDARNSWRFFLEFIFLPFCADWCGHVDVLILSVVSSNVLKQCPEHFAVIFTFCTYPFDTTFVISFLKRLIPHMMCCYHCVGYCFIFLVALWCPKG